MPSEWTLYAYFDGEGAGDFVLLVRPRLQRNYLPLARISQELLDADDAETQKSVAFVNPVVNLEQNFRRILTDVAANRKRA